jgi:hypothetical protein
VLWGTYVYTQTGWPRMLHNEHHNNLSFALNIITEIMSRTMGLVEHLSRLGQRRNIKKPRNINTYKRLESCRSKRRHETWWTFRCTRNRVTMRNKKPFIQQSEALFCLQALISFPKEMYTIWKRTTDVITESCRKFPLGHYTYIYKIKQIMLQIGEYI